MAVSELKRISRAAFVAVAAAVGMVVISCGEYVRNNPFDPAVPVTLTIHGPDSAFAQFDTLRFTVTTDPVYDYDDVQWESSGLQRIDNNGMYQVAPISVYNGRPTTVPITVRIGTRTATKNVYIDFRPVSYRVRFCNFPYNVKFGADSTTATFSSFGQAASVCTSVLDARGGVISTYQYPAPQARSLDTTVARVSPNTPTIVPTGNGTTGIVFTSGSSVDTMKVTVRQVVGSLTVQAPACANYRYNPLAVGDTVRITLGAPAYDIDGMLVTDPAITQAAVAEAAWRPNPGLLDVPIGVTSDGLVTITTAGGSTVSAWLPSRPGAGPVASCVFFAI